MSFNINFNKPVITSAQGSQDGGAGNLGYMKGSGQENSKHQQEANSIFEEQRDTFVRDLEPNESGEGFIDKIILFFKLILKKIFKLN